jgi:hypothetical protein
VPLWTNRYNGPGNDTDEASAVAVDGSGNVFVTGWSWNGSSEDYATVAYSSSGVLLWIRRYGGTQDAEANAIAVDSSGSVLVSGYSESGDQGYVTIKYSGAGVPLWTNTYPGSYTGVLRAMATDHRGNVFVTGDYGTVCYSGTGAPLSTNLYIGTGASGVAVDSTGNVFVTGPWHGGDYVTVKYSAATVFPIPLNYHVAGNQLVLSWTNAAFSLQSAPAVQAAYTNIPGAASPFTNGFTERQRYFRLKGN